MSRKNYNQGGKRFYGHDNRFDDDQSIRHVSFQSKFKSKKHSAKNLAKIRDRLGWVEEADVDDGWNNRFVQVGRRGRGPRGDGQFGRGGSGGQKRAYWYLITVVNGGRYNRADVLGSIEQYLAPQKFYPICYQIIRSDSEFYVEQFQMAQLLLSCTRKITMADGQLLVLKIKDSKPPQTAIDDVMTARIKTAMSKRYVPETKALNLSRFHRDPEFVDGLFVHLCRPPVFMAVLKIITEHIPDLVALDLSGNNLSEFAHVASLLAKLKDLRILVLTANFIKQLSVLNCFKEMEISNLMIDKNPIGSSFADRQHFVSEIRKRFPKLTKLDNTDLLPIVTFDIGDEGSLPTPQAAFVCAPEGRDFIKAFLSQYYQIYDSDNRFDLAQAYEDQAMFSLISIGQENGPRLNAYTNESRNLLRFTSFPQRKAKLHTGKEEIVKFLSNLPKTQHDLMSFVVDLPFFSPELITLSVSGVFRETGVGSSAHWPVRNFSRTFLIVPMGAGFVIVNDTLYVNNATKEQSEAAFKDQAASAVSSPAGPSSPPTVVPSPTSPILNDNIKLEMVQTVAVQTGMNLDWSRKCLEETEWDLQRAAWTFNELQKKGAIPAEAFIK